MKRLTIVSAVLCLSLLASGCTTKAKTLTSETHAPAGGTAMSEAQNNQAVNGQHDVKVEDLSKDNYTDSNNDTYTSVYPKLIVDGKEAAEINESLRDYIKKTYPIKVETEYGITEGYETSYKWAVKGNIVSIVIHVSGICSDYFTNEAFNYDLDTLKPIDDSEVVKRLGMTDEAFFGKTSDILKKECKDIGDYDLDKTLASVNYDNITPFITSDGKPGVVAGIYYAADSQFGGMVSVRGFNLETGERA